MIGRHIAHYEILESLGRGGMGEVFLALDTKLNRKVAVKALPKELASDPERANRFQREARAVAALNHPSVVTIHAIEEVEGDHFIVMELVDGRTLGEILPHKGLPVAQLLDCALAITGAVGAAHRKGIIHRDLKPSNVMVHDDGRVKVLDFGLAKLLEPAMDAVTSQDSTASMTAIGRVLGTVAYMSPEQAQGLPVGPQADVFSLGVILYEMATGRRPFAGKSNLEILSAIMKDPTPSPTRERPDLPPDLARILQRCLHKEVDRRYATAVELKEDLEQLRQRLSTGSQAAAGQPPFPATPAGRKVSTGWGKTAAVAISILLLALTWSLFRQRPATSPTADQSGIDSLAVLPFDNLSGQPEHEYFADGLTESLIAELGQLGAPRKVTARTSVMRYKGSGKPLQEIARELAVAGIVESAVLYAGDRIRITAKLFHAPSETLLWSQIYEGDLGDILELQRSVALAIAREIQIEVTAPEERPSGIEPDVYKAYLRGRFHWNQRTPEALLKALEHFQQAVNQDPSYALAHSSIAETYVLLGSFGYSVMSPLESIPRAKAAALRAIELDNELPEAHTALAMSLVQSWQWHEAETEFLRAIDLNPSNALARHQYAAYLSLRGRHREAIEQILEARAVDPVSPIVHQAVAITHYFAGDYDQAIAESRRTLEMTPGFWVSHLLLGNAYSHKGAYQEAERELQRALESTQGNLFVLASLGLNQIRRGRLDEARATLAEIRTRSDTEYVAPSLMAKLHLGLDELNPAFDWMRQAVEERDHSITYLRVDPDFAPARSDPRFADLVGRLGLAS